MSSLSIRDLTVSVKDDNDNKKIILNGVNLEIKSGQKHAIMGPNGSGKSTLSYTIMGHPSYTIESGEILLDGENINDLNVDKRSKMGLFLAMQYPVEVQGVGLSNFLRTSINANSEEKINLREFVKTLKEEMAKLKMEDDFSSRHLNVGFSGGEKKRTEILQLNLLKPKFAILDETDSGLDVDALKIVSDGINRAHENNNMGIMLVTHYTRILKYVKPDFVHVFKDGKIAESGDTKLADYLEENGYKDWE